MPDPKQPKRPRQEDKHDEDVVPTKTLAETENYMAWLSHEPDGETVVHLELGPVTLHFFREEWEELIALVQVADKGV